MFRYLKILAWCGFGFLATLALYLFIVAAYDWNRIRPWLNARVAEASGRPFAIRGDLSVKWRRPDNKAAGTHRWLPWPHVSASDIVLGNPSWVSSAPHMAQVEQVTFSLSPIALLRKKILVKNLRLNAPLLHLQRAKNGDNNWTFTANPDSAWQFEIRQLGFHQGTVRVVDAIRQANLIFKVDTPEAGAAADGGLEWSVSGSLGTDTVTGSGRAGALLALQQHDKPYPVQAKLSIGKTTIDFKGTLTNPRALGALDVRLKLAGVSMAKLYALTNIPFPETPAFATEGRLIGKFNKAGKTWQYEKFSGMVGRSDLSGSLIYVSKKPRGHLQGTLVSKNLVLRDLAPLIGADTEESKAKRGAAVRQPAEKVLPVEAFKTERWRRIDADIKFTARRILRDKKLPIENVVADLTLQDGVLSFKPLNFGIAGGNLVSTIVLDGRGKLIKVTMRVAARHLKIKQLLPEFEPMKSSLGELNGDASLSATGNSIAAMLGASNGEVKAFIDGGTVSKLWLEKIGLNIGNVILTQLSGDKQVRLHCLASDFGVTKGVMQTRTFVIDTEDAILDISGQIDLAQERLDLTIKPDTKTLRLISLRAPFYVTGSFKSPQVNVDKGVLAVKAGAALALGVLAPVLTAVLPLVNLGPGKDSDCEALLKDVRKKPMAPLAGKIYRAKAAAKPATK